MGTKTKIAKFELSRDGETVMATIEGKVSFLDRKIRQPQPQVEETWEVEIVGQNPNGRVNFLRVLRQVKLQEWTWNDGLESRSRRPACLVIAADGSVHRFTGSEIPDLVQVMKTNYKKNGKWSNTTYYCASPQGTAVYSWRQSWEEGLFWTQASWEEAFQTVRDRAPQVKISSLEAIIRQYWEKEAKNFDDNRASIQAFAEASAGVAQAGQGEVELIEWTWNNGLLSRGYRPVCYVVAPQGTIHKFAGASIPGVCKVLKYTDEQKGKWSNTTYHCVSPVGCTIVRWSQEWESGVYWPQNSWEEAIAWFQAQAPQTTVEEIVALVRRYHEPAAQKFDEHQNRLK
jgi:hypothetical protein